MSVMAPIHTLSILSVHLSNIKHQEINRILSKSKILLVLYLCEYLLTIHTTPTYQSTYFIDYFMQGNFKYPRIMKIQQVHQKLQTKQFQLVC